MGNRIAGETGFRGYWGHCKGSRGTLVPRYLGILSQVELLNSTGDIGNCDILSPQELMRPMSTFLYIVISLFILLLLGFISKGACQVT